MAEGRNEADRLRVILETLTYAQPELKLAEALPMVWEIEKRTLSLESPDDPGKPKSNSPADLADWLNRPAQKWIQDKIPTHMINAIKDLRAETGVGLKEAKDGVEYWRDHYSGSF